MDASEAFAVHPLLSNDDFPDDFVNMQHPDDFTVVSKPFVDYIPRFRCSNTRLIVRVCWRMSNTEFMPVSFVVDIGAPMGLYLSEKAYSELERVGRIRHDQFGRYAEIPGIGRAAVRLTPPGHVPANIVGLVLITELGLTIGPGIWQGFKIINAPDAW